jgi:REP element-mobilizing transposase RayT
MPRAARSRSPRQLAFGLKPKAPKGRGGARPGAGRPAIPEHKRGYVVHRERPEIRKLMPAHVSLRLRDGRPSLRRKDVFRVLRRAVVVARRKGLRIIHFSILSNHLHLLVETSQSRELSRELQSLAISFARHLNRLTGERGSVFTERYHLRLLKTPTEARRALEYVLSNESKHAGRGLGTFFVNPFSSGYAFDDWRELFGTRYGFKIATDWSIERIERWLAEAVSKPRTWMLSEGWRRGRGNAMISGQRTA